MRWFKHYHNADTSHKLCLLMEEYGVEAYGRYWLLLELLCEKYTGNEEEIEVTERELCRKLRRPFPKKMKTFLKVLENLSLFKYKVSGKTFKFETGILLELKQKDFKKPQLNRNSTAIKSPLRDKRKEERGKREEGYTEAPPGSSGLKITVEHVIKSWEALGHRFSGFNLTRRQLEKLFAINEIYSAEQYDSAIERLKTDEWFNSQEKKNIDMILSDEVLGRTLQKPTHGELRGMIHEN